MKMIHPHPHPQQDLLDLGRSVARDPTLQDFRRCDPISGKLRPLLNIEMFAFRKFNQFRRDEEKRLADERR